MNDGLCSFDENSLDSSVECGDDTMSGGLLQCSPQDEVITILREEKKQLEQTVERMDEHIGKLETQLCKLRTGLLPEQDEETEEWLQMHSHCTSSTCWRQKYAESLMQLRAALVEVKNELEKQPCKPSDGQTRISDLRMIEESLRSIGPVGPPVRNLKRPSSSVGPHHFKSPRLAPSESKTSLGRRPFFTRMINIFRRNNASTNS